MNETLIHLRSQLRQHSDETIRAGAQRYFKEHVECYGIKTMTNTLISKEVFKTIKSKPKSEIFGICEELWKSGLLEETYIAGHWAYMMRKQYEREDFLLFESWVDQYITNWASCDNFCNHAMGEIVVQYPEFLQDLKRWAKSENRWMRRASAVSLIVPGRKGLFLKEIFEIADILLMDPDDMVQKGYGWMLKVASHKHLQEVYEYVISKKAVMPRTAYRYAIEKMPEEMKKRAMGK